MAGIQAQGEECPEGYTRVFGPLCIEQTTLAKIDEAIPDLPEFNFTDPGCESALSALKSVADTVKKALETPQNLIKMAQSMIEKPFNEAQKAVTSALGVIDEISSTIDDMLSGATGMIGDFKRALEKMLACPFIADMPIAKTAAALLDALDSGNPITDMLSDFKSQLANAAKEQLDQIKEQPLSSLNNLQQMLDDMIERSGVQDLLKQMEQLYECVRAVCDMIQVAKRLPKTPGEIMEGINAKIDEATGKLKAAVVKPVNAAQQAAKELADAMTVIKLAGEG